MRRTVKNNQYKDLRQKINWAVKLGKLTRPKNCSLCKRNNLKINAHHEDYGKPFDVIWLCNRCHLRIHCNIPWDRNLKPTKPYVNDKQKEIMIVGTSYQLPVLKKGEYCLKGLLLESNIEDEHQKRTEKIRWRELFSCLSFRQRRIIILHYGIEQDIDFTFKEISKEFKVSKSRIHQIHQRALRELRRKLDEQTKEAGGQVHSSSSRKQCASQLGSPVFI